jgi:transposase-like protein
MGRPSKYNSKLCEEVTRFMAEGYSKQALAGKLGISRDTLYEWCKTHKEFSDTIKRGEAQSLLYWEQAGIDGMIGKIKGFRPAVWIFVMKNRFGWRDNVTLVEEVEEPKAVDREDPAVRMRRIVEKYGKTLLLHSSPATAS